MHTPQVGVAETGISNAPTVAPVDAASATQTADKLSITSAPKLADGPPPAPAESARPQASPEVPTVRAEPDARRQAPALPPAATLGPPLSARPRLDSPAAAPGISAPAAGVSVQQPRRFALLAACVALSASLGGLGGSLAVAGLGHLLAPPPAPPPAHADASEEIRALKDSIAPLRASLKTIGDNVAAVRAGLNASVASSTAQFAKIAEAVEKLERRQAERHAAAAPPPTASHEATGSIAAAAVKPTAAGVVDGWVLRKAYRGAALVEGRYGIIEIEPGDHLPGVGRVEEIKRQDGRWVVVTAKGLIVGAP